MANGDWKRAVHEKRSQRERAIAQVKAILGPECIAASAAIDTGGIGTLTSKLAKGDFTSEDVTKECIARYLRISTFLVRLALS